jgi:Family of unknown function (DUF6599)
MRADRHCSLAESLSGAAILLCLMAVALGVFFRQFDFNPAVLVARNAIPANGAESGAPTAPAWLPPELGVFGRPETFSPDTLYDKIDGKAELYLASGFVRLDAQRFALKAAPDQWLEWFVYHMGTASQAFAVYSMQRRAEGQPLDLADYAYRAQNSIYFICGSNYVEAVASTTSEPLMKATLALTGRFLAANSAGAEPLTELKLLPAENLVPGSFTLQSADVFGFDQFRNVYTGQYKVGDAELLAFVTSCRSPEEAAALRDAYRAFLFENGGKGVEGQGNTAADKPVDILGGIEIVFSEGKFVGGIHAAPALPAAERLAAELHRRLARKPE